MKNFLKYIKEPWRMVVAFDRHIASIVPDKLFIKCHYRCVMGKKLNLKHPQTFNEKIQWLKLYNRDPRYPMLVDKCTAKTYIAQTIGEQYIVPTLGIYDSFDEIDFDKLPDQFVLKCTHDSHSVIICKDKSNFDYVAAKDKLTRSLNRNFYKVFREWAYKSLKPRIIAEKLLAKDLGSVAVEDVADYKFYCFNGHAEAVMVCVDRQIGDVKFAYFDQNWNLLDWTMRDHNVAKDCIIPRPEKLDEMFRLANTLAKDFPFVRVDLYFCNNEVYFGELTFYPAGGVDLDYTAETDAQIGDLLDLNKAD